MNKKLAHYAYRQIWAAKLTHPTSTLVGRFHPQSLMKLASVVAVVGPSQTPRTKKKTQSGAESRKSEQNKNSSAHKRENEIK